MGLFLSGVCMHTHTCYTQITTDKKWELGVEEDSQVQSTCQSASTVNSWNIADTGSGRFALHYLIASNVDVTGHAEEAPSNMYRGSGHNMVFIVADSTF